MNEIDEELKCLEHFEAYVLEQSSDEALKCYSNDEMIIRIVEEDDDHFAYAVVIRLIEWSSDCVDCIAQDEDELDDQDEEL